MCTAPSMSLKGPIRSTGFRKYCEKVWSYVSVLDRSSYGGYGLSSSACSWRVSRWFHHCPPVPSSHSQLSFPVLSAHFQCLDPWACKIYHPHILSSSVCTAIFKLIYAHHEQKFMSLYLGPFSDSYD